MISGTYNNPTRERFRARLEQQERERIMRETHYEHPDVQEITPPFEVVGALTFDPDTDRLRAA